MIMHTLSFTVKEMKILDIALQFYYLRASLSQQSPINPKSVEQLHQRLTKDIKTCEAIESSHNPGENDPDDDPDNDPGSWGIGA